MNSAPIGKITGRSTTSQFKFEVTKNSRKFEYVKVDHKNYGWVLCQVVEIEMTEDRKTAFCTIIGFKNKAGKICKLHVPFSPGSDVEKAEEDFIRDIIQLSEDDNSAVIGKLDAKTIHVHIDLKQLLTKHVAILAKSGAGKSYTVGVLLEEIIRKKVPLLVIDPHGEYSSMRDANESKEDKKKLEKYDIEPKGFGNIIQEYGDAETNPSAKPLKLASTMSGHELANLIPGKLSASQQGILYSALRNHDAVDFSSLLFELDKDESNAKWSLIHTIEHLQSYDIFSQAPTPYNELIKSGSCSIVNLRGTPPELQEIIVTKLCTDLFELRKKERIPPFFLVVEEAHNFCPERSFGETKCSRILRTIASEGRKFGLGLCVVSQRPARVDKSVLSQCTTQIILKVTNPNDVKAISSSVEGITSATESEMQNLNIGTAIVCGVVDVPLFVNIRPRQTRHGGEAVDILKQNDSDFMDQLDEFQQKDVRAVIKPNHSINDVKLMTDFDVEKVQVESFPGFMFICKDNQRDFKVLVEATQGNIVVDKNNFEMKSLPKINELSKREVAVLRKAHQLKAFTIEDMMNALGSGLDTDADVKSLTKKGYIDKTSENSYTVSSKFIFQKLSKFAFYDKIEFMTIGIDKEHKATRNVDELKEELSKFVTVSDYQEVTILKYVALPKKVEKKGKK